ncbi:MAG: PDZ domain-containing protein, partial [Candidatus Omnitrophica bacterium]|nr:PDZ domain-containing protein [Candidatus Omnitrophota bacterium]
GVLLQPLDEELAKSFGLSEIKGALVAQVIDNSPAEKGGIKEGDVIIEYEGNKVEDVKDLQMKVANTPPGKNVTIGIWRDKKKINLNIKVGEMPEEGPTVLEKEERLWRGIRVSSLTEEMRAQFDIEDNEGVVVTYVETSSPADESGIKVGSVIKMINNYKISNISDYRNAIKNIPKNQEVRVLIKYGGRSRFMILKGEK